MDPLKFIEWGLTHGVPGILSIACLGMGWVIYKLHSQTRSLAEARVADMKQFTDILIRLQDKGYKLGSDMAKTVDFIERQQRTHRRLP